MSLDSLAAAALRYNTTASASEIRRPKSVIIDAIDKDDVKYTPDFVEESNVLNENKAYRSPIACRLGLPLMFRVDKSRSGNAVNRSADILSNEIDFGRSDEDIAKNGFYPVVDGVDNIYGAIELFRSDQRDLHWVDYEALGEYIAKHFKTLVGLVRFQTASNFRLAEAQYARYEWETYANPEQFAAWWHLWREKRLYAGTISERIRCPVGLAPIRDPERTLVGKIWDFFEIATRIARIRC